MLIGSTRPSPASNPVAPTNIERNAATGERTSASDPTANSRHSTERHADEPGQRRRQTRQGQLAERIFGAMARMRRDDGVPVEPWMAREAPSPTSDDECSRCKTSRNEELSNGDAVGLASTSVPRSEGNQLPVIGRAALPYGPASGEPVEASELRSTIGGIADRRFAGVEPVGASARVTAIGPTTSSVSGQAVGLRRLIVAIEVGLTVCLALLAVVLLLTIGVPREAVDPRTDPDGASGPRPSAPGSTERRSGDSSHLIER